MSLGDERQTKITGLKKASARLRFCHSLSREFEVEPELLGYNVLRALLKATKHD